MGSLLIIIAKFIGMFTHSYRDHAKLLWKRIPPALKLAHPELGRLWEIGKRLWQREFEAVYGLVGDPATWPEYLLPMVTSLVGKGFPPRGSSPSLFLLAPLSLISTYSPFSRSSLLLLPPLPSLEAGLL